MNDLARRQVTVVRRDRLGGQKEALAIDSLALTVPALLDDIHVSMFNKVHSYLTYIVLLLF